MRIIALLALVLSAALGLGAATPPRPNLLVIMADDLDVTSFDLAMPRTKTAVAARGMTFTRALVSTPLCCPSRASLLRGQYAHNHGVLSNKPPDGGYGIFQPLEHATIATHLQASGYATAMIGKHLNGYGHDFPLRGRLPVPPGWSTWAAMVGDGDYHTWTLNLDGQRIVPVGSRRRTYLTDRLADLVEDTIRSAPPPWFVLFMPYAPHKPAEPAPRHAGAFATAELPRPPSFNEADVLDKPAWVRTLPPQPAGRIVRLEELHRRRLESLARRAQDGHQALDRLVQGRH
jgi:arylsulfatase A-like enzyme